MPPEAGTRVEIAPPPPAERPAFPNYTQLATRVPLGAWRVARAVTLLAGLGLCVVLVVSPDTGLRLFWRLAVPLLPLVWLCAPGLWRNLCPLATSNQVPRVFGFTRGAATPPWFARFAYVIGLVALFALIPARKVLFNRSGPATAALLLTVLCLAFLGGLFFKGKSGWCSTVCPLLPVQRLYGETPFLLVRNSHCEPCVGCAKNCYDFNPRVAKLADLDDDDPRYAAPRRWFAAAYPGLVLGFFTMANLPDHSTGWVYGRIALFVAVSVGAYSLVESFVSVSAHRLTAAFAAFGLNAFYWFSVPILVDTLGGSPTGDVRSIAVWLGRLAVLGLTVPWLVRTFAKEPLFLAAAGGAPVVAPSGLVALRAGAMDTPSVTFDDGLEVAVTPGVALLDVIERAGLAMEAGCRLGVCGSDPVAVLDGQELLSPVAGDEASTLARLDLAANTRLACQARVHGPCRISLTPDRATPAAGGDVSPPTATVDPDVRRLVIVGTGIAGATAADCARRLHPECEIHLIGDEPHRLYNRMALSRLIYGRSAMQGLYLQPDSWYDDHHINGWLNTRARSLDPAGRTVTLATGELLGYDRLILALGSRSVVPEIPGIGLPGSFTLRDADGAIALKAYVQRHDVRAAVVAGGGLLGIESAYALHRLGLQTTVIESGGWIMRRQLDEASARLVERYLEALGIAILTGSATEAVVGGDRVEGVRLEGGRRLAAGLLLSCPGIVANAELARDAGLEVGRGVVVDARMRTSDPSIYAAGDVVEFGGEVIGLWPASTRQGEVAAVNAVGGDAVFTATPPTTLLKVSGIDVASIGRVEAAPTDVVVTDDDADEGCYRRLVVADGRAAGAILVGHPLELPAVQRAVEQAEDVSGQLDRLRAGDWSALSPAGGPP